MKSSELLYIFAEANRKAGQPDYANLIEKEAVKREAQEIVDDEGGECA